MNIQLKTDTPLALQADSLILGLFEGTKTLPDSFQLIDRALGGTIAEAIARKEFKPELNETFVLPGTRKAHRILLVGLGEAEKFTQDRLRQAIGSAMKAARDLRAKRVSIAGFSLPSDRELVQAIVEGAELGLYTYEECQSKNNKDEPAPRVEHLAILLPKVTAQAEAGLHAGIVTAEAVNWVRDITNRPAGSLTPSDLAAEARAMAEPRGLKIKVLGKKELKAQGFGCLLAVNAGSTRPPAFIIIEYHGGKKGDKPYALVGKGLTFDAGGLCIKPSAGMLEMKSDMAGAAAVLGAIRVLADLRVPVNVVGLISSTENMPGPTAYKPGDILKNYGGLTVEVVDTDAEGRVVLSDALAYADRNYDPRATIDLATLTGSIIVALGPHVTGLFSNDSAIADRLYQAGQKTGERVWPMPMWDAYTDRIESDIADVKNSDHSKADCIAAAKFLEKFAGKRPFAHLDIAGPSWIDDDRPYELKGATGHGVRLLVEFLGGYR